MAGRLHDSLALKFGRNKLFMDVDNIPVGRDFEEHLNSQVAACDAMLAVIGPNWLTAKDETGQRRLDNPEDFVAIEIGAALARNIPVVPVLVDGARMPKVSELPIRSSPLPGDKRSKSATPISTAMLRRWLKDCARHSVMIPPASAACAGCKNRSANCCFASARRGWLQFHCPAHLDRFLGIS